MTAVSRSVSSAPALLTSIAPRWIALALFGLTLALRLPFASQWLYHWDSVNHALALTSFDIVAHRPQPPGYILYIAFARLVNLILPDAQTALVTVSIVASAAAVAFLFLLGTRMAGRAVGAIAALLLLTSPAFWFDGEVALPYVVEGAASVVCAYLLWRLDKGETHLAPLTAVALAIAIGMRQQLALFFAPLALYVFWKTSWRVRLKAVLWFAGVCALWFVPMVWSTGGLGEYVRALRNLNNAFSSEYALLGTGGEGGLERNVARMGAYTLYALNLAVVPLLLGGGLVVRDAWRLDRGREFGRDERVRFVLLWIAPCMLFYVFFHMGSPGLIYVFLPALYLVAAVGLRSLVHGNGRREAAVVAILIAANVFVFFGTPTDLYTGRDIRVLNYRSLVAHDEYIRGRVEAIRQNFDPQTTLLLATDWRFPEYYLPEYRMLNFPGTTSVPVLLIRDREEVLTTLDDAGVRMDGVKKIVLFDGVAAQFYHGGETFRCQGAGGGECVPSISVDGADYDLARNGIVERAP